MTAIIDSLTNVLFDVYRIRVIKRHLGDVVPVHRHIAYCNHYTQASIKLGARSRLLLPHVLYVVFLNQMYMLNLITSFSTFNFIMQLKLAIGPYRLRGDMRLIRYSEIN